MLRLLLLCAFVTAGLGLSAQETAAKPACNPAQCVSKTAANTSCQAKTTSVAATSETAPERASAVAVAAEKEAAPVAQTTLLKLTSFAPKSTSCQPADCKKTCNPSQCTPPQGLKTAAAPVTKSTAVAVKQE